jgi:hypothetical protein
MKAAKWIKLKFWSLVIARMLLATYWTYKIYLETGGWTAAFCVWVFLFMEVRTRTIQLTKEKQALRNDLLEVFYNQIKNQN